MNYQATNHYEKNLIITGCTKVNCRSIMVISRGSQKKMDAEDSIFFPYKTLEDHKCGGSQQRFRTHHHREPTTFSKFED